MIDILAAKAMLEAAGYRVLAPPAEKIPEPAVGQLWAARNQPRIRSRMITFIGRDSSGSPVLRYEDDVGDTGAMQPSSFICWARRSGARPA